MEVATPIGLRPADFPIGSPQSRAAARHLAEQREIGAMQDWAQVIFEDLKCGKAFAEKLQSQDTTNRFQVRLIVRKRTTDQQAEDAKLSLTFAHEDEERALKIIRILAERHGGVVVYVDVPPRESLKFSRGIRKRKSPAETRGQEPNKGNLHGAEYACNRAVVKRKSE